MKKNSDVLLKICGMRDEENIRDVAALAPDYMGFIFYPGSKRFVGNEFRVPDHLPERIKKVGVFVNEDTTEILRLATANKLEYIQLHGEESVKQCTELGKQNLKVIKVFSVNDQFDFKRVIPFKEHVAYFLFDTMGENRGGNGEAFDWKILGSYDQDVPFFLSGGISAENIRDVNLLKDMNLHALDVNSRIERKPGIKNISLIHELKNEMQNL